MPVFGVSCLVLRVAIFRCEIIVRHPGHATGVKSNNNFIEFNYEYGFFMTVIIVLSYESILL